MSDDAIHLAADVLDCCMTVSPEVQAEMRYRDCLLFAQALHAAGLLTTTKKEATMTTTEPDCIKGTHDGNPIKPEDCTPDQVFEGIVDGKRVMLRRNNPTSIFSWEAVSAKRSDSPYYQDGAVSDLVPLVPARPITWADIPEYIDGRDELWGLTIRLRELIAERLNARGGAPTTAPAVGDAESDPIVEAIRESDLAAVGVTKADGCWKLKNGSGIESIPRGYFVEKLDEHITFLLARAAAYLAVKRAIEAEEKAKKAEKGAARAEWTTALFGHGTSFLELGDRERGLVDKAIAKAGEDR